MTGRLVLGGFAGPGGWCEGLRIAGHTGPSVGIELDMAACRTAQAAGHQRIRADVATWHRVSFPSGTGQGGDGLLSLRHGPRRMILYTAARIRARTALPPPNHGPGEVST